MNGLNVARHGARTLKSKVKRAVRNWDQLPMHCPRCCHPIDGECVNYRERMTWCPQCRDIVRISWVKAPNWITGVLATLLVNSI